MIKVTFASRADAEAIALAQLGQSDSVIERDCKLTPGQISYRLRKAKDLLGMKQGFRTMWRRGEGPLVRRVKDEVLAVLRQDIQRNLPGKIIHAPARVVKEQDGKFIEETDK